MYTLYTGVTYTEGSMNLDEVSTDNIDDLVSEIKRILVDEEDAVTVIMTVSYPKP